ncbi:MAG: hypothetical protein LAT56_13420, partial [Wenzhouxiangella sp.]|nr:hypothetical protein [Wenzhouxiangella sp.]
PSRRLTPVAARDGPDFTRFSPVVANRTSSGQALNSIWDVAEHREAWICQVQGTESIYYRAIGSAEALMAKAEALGQVWMKGVAS